MSGATARPNPPLRPRRSSQSSFGPGFPWTNTTASLASGSPACSAGDRTPLTDAVVVVRPCMPLPPRGPRSPRRRDGRERLRLSEGVSDALPGRRVLEVAGVTDQSPARTSGFAKETLELQEPEHLSHGTRAGEHFGDRSARPRVSHERRLAFPSKLG